MNNKAIFFSIFIVFVSAAVLGYALFALLTTDSVMKSAFYSKEKLDGIYSQRDSYVFYSEAAAEIAAKQALLNSGFEKTGSFSIDSGFLANFTSYFNRMIGNYPDNSGEYAISLEGDSIKLKKAIYLKDYALNYSGKNLNFPFKAEYSEEITFTLTYNKESLSRLNEIRTKLNDKAVSVDERTKLAASYEEELKNLFQIRA